MSTWPFRRIVTPSSLAASRTASARASLDSGQSFPVRTLNSPGRGGTDRRQGPRVVPEARSDREDIRLRRQFDDAADVRLKEVAAAEGMDDEGGGERGDGLGGERGGRGGR